MCGIIGWVGRVREGAWGEAYRLTHALLLAAQHRGEHATGFVAVTEPLDGPTRRKVVASKAPLSAERFAHTDPTWRGLRHRRCAAFVGHVRFATNGSPLDNRNNHPHRSGHLFLVHNGVIANHREVADRYRLRLETECDSECLARLAAFAPHPVDGITACLRECSGSMAVAAYDEQLHAVYLARNHGRPLWMARLRRDARTYFASTGEILIRAFSAVLGDVTASDLDLFMPLAPGHVYTLNPDGASIHAPTRADRLLNL